MLEEPEGGVAIEAGHPTSVKPILEARWDVSLSSGPVPRG